MVASSERASFPQPKAVRLLPRALAEGIGTAFLLAVVAGSGIMGEKLASGNVAIALLANSLATGAGLIATVGAFVGVAAAHLMFGLQLFSASHHTRPGLPQMFAEFVATFGLVLVIRGASQLGILATAVAVGCYIAAAYWFTSSTSFANPAVTLARSVSDTFVGIQPRDVPGFLVAQFAGAGAAALFLRSIRPTHRPSISA